MPYDKSTAKKRWTVEMMQVYRRFCGWDTLRALSSSIGVGMRGSLDEVLIHDERERDEARAMIATVFETGARICEVIGQHVEGGVEGLRVGDITIQEKQILVTFRVEKRYRKRVRVPKFKATDGTMLRWLTLEEAEASRHPYEEYLGYATDRVIRVRNIALPPWEPLISPMLDWVECVKREGEGNAKLFGFGYNKAYRIIKKAGNAIGADFPPHRLRAERATQLALECDFTDHDLTEWFDWRNPKEAQAYTTLAPKIAEKLFRKRS